jgi:hypothetical protein
LITVESTRRWISAEEEHAIGLPAAVDVTSVDAKACTSQRTVRMAQLQDDS